VGGERLLIEFFIQGAVLMVSIVDFVVRRLFQSITVSKKEAKRTVRKWLRERSPDDYGRNGDAGEIGWWAYVTSEGMLVALLPFHGYGRGASANPRLRYSVTRRLSRADR